MFHYQTSVRGEAHKRFNIACQDANYYIKVNDNMSVGAVSDGLGSELHSDIASSIAAKKACIFCARNIHVSDSDESILDKIKIAFLLALDSINFYILQNIEKRCLKSMLDIIGMTILE